MNNQAIFCVTENGIEIAKKINEKISSDVFVIEKFNKNFGISFTSLKEVVNENFKKYKYLIFIMATGIVTRIIAPHILKKDVDPAVISIDEQGNFVFEQVEEGKYDFAILINFDTIYKEKIEIKAELTKSFKINMPNIDLKEVVIAKKVFQKI